MGGCWHALSSLGIFPGEASGIHMAMFETDKTCRALLSDKANGSNHFRFSDKKDSTGLTGSALALVENDF
eukprot:913714-Heterocapsa_arctica.AAC.1